MRDCAFSEIRQGHIYRVNERYIVVALTLKRTYSTDELSWKVHTLMGVGSTGSMYDNETIEEMDYEELSLYLGTFDYESPVLEPLLKEGRSILNDQGGFRIKVTEEGKKWEKWDVERSS